MTPRGETPSASTVPSRLLMEGVYTPSKILSYICNPLSAVARFMGLIANS